jgi:2-dehydro-3-deoxygluconokinase
MKKIVTFGEIMLRLCPPGHQRINQTVTLDVTYGGAEANAAVSLAAFGIPVSFITRVPENDLGKSAIAAVRATGVDVNSVLYGGDRLGVYFLEMGAGPRSSKVIYDRADSSLATLQPGMIDWQTIFSNAGWFHWTGITPAVSEAAALSCLEAIHNAKKAGLIVSCDLNYRSALWKYGKQASDVIPEMVRSSDVLLCDPESVEKMLGLKLSPSDAEVFLKEVVQHFPNLRTVASTHRKTIHAGHNFWTGSLWHQGKFFQGPVYEITQIVDRVGSGDAFMAGLIYGLLNYKADAEQIIQFALAASFLKHTVPGDFNRVSVEEVLAVMHGDNGGKVKR